MSTSRSTTRRFATGFALLGALLGTAPAVASAEPAAAAAPAPQCVKATQDKGVESTTVKLTNNCKKQKRVKVVMDRGRDSRCITVNKGQTRTHKSHGARPNVNRLVAC